LQLPKVIVPALGGVVGEKRVAKLQFAERVLKRQSAWKQRFAAVDGSIHVEGDMANALQTIR
jgi:hypothetical protein